MEKKYGSEALMVSHQSAQDLFELGLINAEEMREFDEVCLVQGQESAWKPAPPQKMGHLNPTVAGV